MPEAVPNTMGKVHLDLEEISAWLGAIGGVLERLDPGTKAIQILAGQWEPPPTATPAPIASPKCIRPPRGSGSSTSIADLIGTLVALRNWTKALSDVL